MADYCACNRFDVMNRLPEIHLPVQVICGADDLLTPSKYSDYLTKHIVRARQTIIPHAGHLAPVEQPAAVNTAIRKFITETFGAQKSEKRHVATDKPGGGLNDR